MKSLNYKCQGRSLLINFWLSICIIHKSSEECAVSLLFWIMPCLLFALNSHNMCLSLRIHLALRAWSLKILAFMSFLTGKNLPWLLHNIQKWLCSAKPWVLTLRNWNELAVILLRINTYHQKKPTLPKFSFGATFEEISREEFSSRHWFLLKTSRECWNS